MGILDLFRGKSYGSGEAKRNQTAALTSLQGTASRFGGYGDQADRSYQNYNPRYEQSVNALDSYYGRDPRTDQRKAEYLAPTYSQIDADTQRAEANNISRGIKSGLSTPGGDPNSITSGMNTYLQARAIAGRSGAQNQYADWANGVEERRLGARANLLGGVANQEYGRATDAYGRQAGLESGLAGQYGQQYSQAIQSEQADQGSVMGLLSGAAQLAGDYYGLPGGGRKSAAPAFSPGVNLPAGYGSFSSGFGAPAAPADNGLGHYDSNTGVYTPKPYTPKGLRF